MKQNENFSVTKKEYYLKNDTVVTEHVNGSVTNLTDQGILEVVYDGQVIQSIHLEQKEPKIVQVQKEKPISSEQEQH